MPRPRERVCIQDGLKLDLNRLARRGFVQPGYKAGPHLIQWTNSYSGEIIASGFITAEASGPGEGWFRFEGGNIDQWIGLAPRPRHFGGRQWYFICPFMNRRVSVLWKPPGARDFACRQRWGRQVAYNSQFSTPVDRAHQGKAKINSRLCSIGGLDADDWEFPPKPKWMRWSTYNRAQDKFDHYESILDAGSFALVARLMGRI